MDEEEAKAKLYVSSQGAKSKEKSNCDQNDWGKKTNWASFYQLEKLVQEGRNSLAIHFKNNIAESMNDHHHWKCCHQNCKDQHEDVLARLYVLAVACDLVKSLEFSFCNNAVSLELSLFTFESAFCSPAGQHPHASCSLSKSFLIVDQFFSLLQQSFHFSCQFRLGVVEVILFHRFGSIDPRSSKIEWVCLHPCWQEHAQHTPASHYHQRQSINLKTDSDLELSFCNQTTWRNNFLISGGNERRHGLIRGTSVDRDRQIAVAHIGVGRKETTWDDNK